MRCFLLGAQAISGSLVPPLLWSPGVGVRDAELSLLAAFRPLLQGPQHCLGGQQPRDSSGLSGWLGIVPEPWRRVPSLHCPQASTISLQKKLLHPGQLAIISSLGGTRFISLALKSACFHLQGHLTQLTVCSMKSEAESWAFVSTRAYRIASACLVTSVVSDSLLGTMDCGPPGSSVHGIL